MHQKEVIFLFIQGKRGLIMKRLIFLLILLPLLLGGCSTSSKQETVECTHSWSVCMLNPDFNTVSTDSDQIKVAILDSGINSNLEQLQDYVVKSFNTFDNSSTTTPIDGHGTMIASIVASTSHEGKLIGLNNHVELYDVQVLDEEGTGSIENTVAGIEWAIDQEVDLINISFGFSNDDESIREAIKKAYDNDIIIVAAAGNTFGLTTEYPANYPEVLSISAIDNEMKIFAYSGKGKVDYVAPGVNVSVLNINGELEHQSGTSLATAYATGSISLLKLEMENEDILKHLKKNSIELGSDDTYGEGLIQIGGEE